MPKFKVIYDAPFRNIEDIIEADSLEEAEEIADLKSIFTNFTVEEYFNEKQENL